MEDEIVLSRKKLKEMLAKEYIEASPYVGEYHAGKADLLNEFLGNDPIKWGEHPTYAGYRQETLNVIKEWKKRE